MKKCFWMNVSEWKSSLQPLLLFNFSQQIWQHCQDRKSKIYSTQNLPPVGIELGASRSLNLMLYWLSQVNISLSVWIFRPFISLAILLLEMIKVQKWSGTWTKVHFRNLLPKTVPPGGNFFTEFICSEFI